MDNNNPLQMTPAPIDPPAPSPAPSPQPVTSPHAKKTGTNKLLLIILGLLLIGFGLLGGFFLGQNQRGEKIAPSATPTATLSPTKSPTPTASSGKTKTIKAGMSTSPYSIEVPIDWTDVRENTQAGVIDKLTLSKNGYTLTIYQAAMGGGGCLYPGDAPAEMSQSFTDFAEINGIADIFRRSWNQTQAKTVSYTICKKGTDGSYGSVSNFGAISAVSPNPADPKILAEIDGMVASLVKQ